MAPDFVGDHINECISNPESSIDLSSDGWVSVNDILIEEIIASGLMFSRTQMRTGISLSNRSK